MIDDMLSAMVDMTEAYRASYPKTDPYALVAPAWAVKKAGGLAAIQKKVDEMYPHMEIVVMPA